MNKNDHHKNNLGGNPRPERHFTSEARRLIADGTIPLELLDKKYEDRCAEEKIWFDSLFEEVSESHCDFLGGIHENPFESKTKVVKGPFGEIIQKDIWE